jgi:hypothetical protein
MPVLNCAGGCTRLISVSSIPGGNPVALKEREAWAVNYGTCPGCKSSWCDRCAAKLVANTCPTCQKPLTLFGIVDPAAKPAAPPPAAAAGATATAKPWWKFW